MHARAPLICLIPVMPVDWQVLARASVLPLLSQLIFAGACMPLWPFHSDIDKAPTLLPGCLQVSNNNPKQKLEVKVPGSIKTVDFEVSS